MTNTFTFSSRLSFSLVLSLAVLLQSCSETPDKFFGTAILNTNTISNFATPALANQINDQTLEFADIPSSKKKGNEAAEQVRNNILYMEKSLTDIKALSANDDLRKDIKAQSIALYEYVIPVYKNEYTAYAKLCDTKAPQAKREELMQSVAQKYNAEFEKKYASLLAKGKVFAEENNLNVDWK